MLVCLIPKTPKKLVTLFLVYSFCLVSMSFFSIYKAPPEVEISMFRQENGENLKKAWNRLFRAYEEVTPKIPMCGFLNTFYDGVFR